MRLSITDLKNTLETWGMQMEEEWKTEDFSSTIPRMVRMLISGGKPPKSNKKHKCRKREDAANEAMHLDNDVEVSVQAAQENKASSGTAALESGGNLTGPVRREYDQKANVSDWQRGIRNRAAFGSGGNGALWNQHDAINLYEAVVGAEILGEPISKKRRRRRVKRKYGN